MRYDEIGALELKGKAEPVPAWKAVGLLDAQAARRAPSRLIGKLCLPYALRGLLYWREGKWDEAERLFRRSHELAEQVGCSEVAFSALFGLAVALRDRGDANGSVTALDGAGPPAGRRALLDAHRTGAANRRSGRRPGRIRGRARGTGAARRRPPGAASA